MAILEFSNLVKINSDSVSWLVNYRGKPLKIRDTFTLLNYRAVRREIIRQHHYIAPKISARTWDLKLDELFQTLKVSEDGP